MRWRWIGLAVVGSIGYWLIWGPELRFVRVADENGDEGLAIAVGRDSVVFDVDEDEEEEEEGDGDAEL